MRPRLRDAVAGEVSFCFADIAVALREATGQIPRASPPATRR
ncbi:hypothetical protein [Methanoculleus nereidis]|nr:hypothetical protein [Methanoculleus sp. YWC-01]